MAGRESAKLIITQPTPDLGQRAQPREHTLTHSLTHCARTACCAPCRVPCRVGFKKESSVCVCVFVLGRQTQRVVHVILIISYQNRSVIHMSSHQKHLAQPHTHTHTPQQRCGYKYKGTGGCTRSRGGTVLPTPLKRPVYAVRGSQPSPAQSRAVIAIARCRGE